MLTLKKIKHYILNIKNTVKIGKMHAKNAMHKLMHTYQHMQLCLHNKQRDTFMKQMKSNKKQKSTQRTI